MSILIERTPPPGGGFLFTMFPHPEPWVRGPPRRIWYKFFEGGPLTHGSWWGNIVNRKPPPGGGGFFRSIYTYTNYIHKLPEIRARPVLLRSLSASCVFAHFKLSNLRSCIQTYIYIYIHTYIQALDYDNIYIYTYIHIHIYTYIQALDYSNIYIYTYMYAFSAVSVYMHIRKYVNIAIVPVYMYTCICIYMYIYIIYIHIWL